MKIKKILLVAAAITVIGTATVRPAMAYFTDTVTATGKIPVKLGDSEIIPEESVDGMIKTVTIKNTGKYDVFVRAKAIYGSNYKATILEESKTAGWSYNETTGYYEYKDVVKVNTSSPSLKLEISVINDDVVEDKFNVIIIEEATKVLYNEDGSTYADWNSKVQETTNP